MSAPVAMQANLNLRLEHELQTATRRRRSAQPQFRSTAGGPARRCSNTPLALVGTCGTPEVPAVLILEGIGVRFAPSSASCPLERSLERVAPDRFESGVRLAPVIFLGGAKPGGRNRMP